MGDFDQNNYVQNNGDGTYTAVVNGNPVADNNGNTSFKSLDFTQQAFNANSSPPPSSPAPSSGGGGGGSTSYAEQSLNQQPASGGASSGSYAAQSLLPASGFDAPLGASAPQGWSPTQTVRDLFTAQYGAQNAYSAWLSQNGGATAPGAATAAPAAGGMNAQSFVAPNGTGYAAYANGKNLGNFATQDAAQQAYNSALGLSSALLAPAKAATPNPNQLITVVDGQKTASQIQQILGSQGNPSLAAKAYSTTDPAALAGLYNSTVQSNAAGAQSAVQESALTQLQQNEVASNAKQQALTTNQDALQSLVGQLNGPLSPGVLPVINAALTSLGLPTIGNSADQAGSGVMPNGITPAMWDQMSDAAKQLVLQAWVARGGTAADFQAGIDAQRPQGTRSTSNTFRYAPSPGPVPAVAA